MTAIKSWEHFPHGADVGIRGFGTTKEAAFEQVACAMTAVLADLETVAPDRAVDVRCSAPDDSLLPVEWLNELVYEMAIRGMVFCKFKVRIDDSELIGQAWGESVDVARQQPAVEVKGATVTALDVARRPDGLWVAQCVVDV